jgi:hypothetical protein
VSGNRMILALFRNHVARIGYGGAASW